MPEDRLIDFFSPEQIALIRGQHPDEARAMIASMPEAIRTPGIAAEIQPLLPYLSAEDVQAIWRENPPNRFSLVKDEEDAVIELFDTGIPFRAAITLAMMVASEEDQRLMIQIYPEVHAEALRLATRMMQERMPTIKNFVEHLFG
jgi:hypothetical protein